jgi:hypothetical protein
MFPLLTREDGFKALQHRVTSLAVGGIRLQTVGLGWLFLGVVGTNMVTGVGVHPMAVSLLRAPSPAPSTSVTGKPCKSKTVGASRGPASR